MICQMTLKPALDNNVFQPIKLDLEEGFPGIQSGKVYTSCHYTLRLENWTRPRPSLDALQKAQVFVYDEEQIIHWKEEGDVLVGTPDPKSPCGEAIFRDCFGFAEITILFPDGLCLRSGLLPVMVRNGALTRQVQDMAAYLSQHQEDLLYERKTGSREKYGLRKDGLMDFSAALALAEEIAGQYEASYPYFKANCRFQIQKTPAVQPLERLQYIAPDTLRYAAFHPEELQEVRTGPGVRVGRKTYHPRRALGLVNRASVDTPENRMVLGFLRTMAAEAQKLLDYAKGLLKTFPLDRTWKEKRGEEEGEWESSAWVLLEPLRPSLEASREPLARLVRKLNRLERMYSRLLPIPAPRLVRPPKPTAVLRAVPEYSRILQCCRRWFLYGLYDEKRQELILPFLKIPDLYERYLLARMLACFRKQGWTPTEASRVCYDPPADWNGCFEWTGAPGCRNLFRFQKGDETLTLYYQPVIYSGKELKENKDLKKKNYGVGLFRNSSRVYDRSAGDEDKTGRVGSYYQPDFLLVREDGRCRRWCVADAKFSTLGNIWQYQRQGLTDKYNFSLSPLTDRDRKAGLCIFCGQSGGAWDREGLPEDVYDLGPGTCPETIFAPLFPFPGGAPDTVLEAFLKQVE